MRMGYKRVKLLAAAILVVVASAVPGARAATIMGSGVSLSCGGWVEIRKTPNKAAAEEWTLGYLSGVAMWSPASPLDNLDAGAVFVWLDNFCQQRPLERFKAALDEFVRDRARAARPPAQPSQGKPPAPTPAPAAPANRR